MKQVVEFRVPKRQFILHNAGPEPVELRYGGETKVVPPSTEVIYPHPQYPEMFASGKDADGDYIPGTIQLEDIYEKDPVTGAEKLIWDCWEAAKHCLGLDPRTGEALGKQAARGTSLIPQGASKEDIAEISAAGRLRYEDFRIGEARAVVAAHDEDNARRRRQGHIEIPGDSSYEQALMVLAAASERQKRKVAQIFGDPVQVVAPETGEATRLEAAEPDADGLETFIREQLTNEAHKMALEDETKTLADASALVERLEQDPKIMKALRAKYQMRKWREVERAKHAGS